MKDGACEQMSAVNEDARQVPARNVTASKDIVVAIDTANETIAIGIGRLHGSDRSIECMASIEVHAHRQSNTTLMPKLSDLFDELGLSRHSIGCICVGRGPGSFTGVRIAVATAKGLAFGLHVPLVGASTLDAVAWKAESLGVRGRVFVVADAMRKEVYLSEYMLDGSDVRKLSKERVLKVSDAVSEIQKGSRANGKGADHGLEGALQDGILICGDGLAKYRSQFEDVGDICEEDAWEASGRSLLLAMQALWRSGSIDPSDLERHDPANLLPIYTRLSDAEENERKKASKDDARADGAEDVLASKALSNGVLGDVVHEHGMKESDSHSIDVTLRPMSSGDIAGVSLLESSSMGGDAWSFDSLASELSLNGRIWWVAVSGDDIAGYVGLQVCGEDVELLKIAVGEPFYGCGVAWRLLRSALYDAEALSLGKVFLEVRRSNTRAISFYKKHGMRECGLRRGYYSDGEDAVLMEGDVAQMLRAHNSSAEVAGMQIASDEDSAAHLERPPTHPLILAIESSCDETAASLVDGTGEVLSNVVTSQIGFHARFGGVVPEIASRKHIEAICGVAQVALEGKARTSMLDAIAVTYAPGLVGALVVGVAFAKGMAWALGIPCIGVNHLEGHIYANKLGAKAGQPFVPPALVSLVSGGNTMLVLMRDWGDYQILGETIDDAVGEAFDKVAKAMGLPYPGGPEISRLAESGDPSAYDFPRALIHSKDYRFSLSGLKTAVTVQIDKLRQEDGSLSAKDMANICASFEQAVVDVQIAKTREALKSTGAKTLCLGGGVSANPRLRREFADLCDEMGVRLIVPPIEACGDNAEMIALVALDRYDQGKFFDLDFDAHARADLSEPY